MTETETPQPSTTDTTNQGGDVTPEENSAHPSGGSTANGKVILHPRQKKEKPQKKQPKDPKPPPKDPTCSIDCRVGKIIEVSIVPEADTLYREEVDCGNGIVKHVVTSVRKYYTEEQLLNRRVCVFVNIHPGKMRGETSEAMLLGASTPDPDICELLDPPQNDPIGTRILFGHFNDGENAPEGLDNKNKQWKKILPHLHINKEGVATYKDEPLHTESGNITVPSLVDCEFH